MNSNFENELLKEQNQFLKSQLALIKARLVQKRIDISENQTLTPQLQLLLSVQKLQIALQSQTAKMQTQNDLIDKLKKEKSRLQSEVGSLSSKFNKLQRQCRQQASRTREHQKKLQSKESRTEQILDQLETELQQAQVELQQLQSLKAIQDQSSSQIKKLRQLERQKAVLTQELKALQLESAQKLNRSKAPIHALQSSISELQNLLQESDDYIRKQLIILNGLQAALRSLDIQNYSQQLQQQLGSNVNVAIFQPPSLLRSYPPPLKDTKSIPLASNPYPTLVDRSQHALLQSPVSNRIENQSIPIQSKRKVFNVKQSKPIYVYNQKRQQQMNRQEADPPPKKANPSAKLVSNSLKLQADKPSKLQDNRANNQRQKKSISYFNKEIDKLQYSKLPPVRLPLIDARSASPTHQTTKNQRPRSLQQAHKTKNVFRESRIRNKQKASVQSSLVLNRQRPAPLAKIER